MPISPHPTITRSSWQNARLLLPTPVSGDGPYKPFPRLEKGHVYVFTLIDHLTGWADAYPISNKRCSTIADILHREYFTCYSPPDVLISDNGTEFVNSTVTDLCKAWGVERRTTTVYHPQSNGGVERFYRTLKGVIKRLMWCLSDAVVLIKRGMPFTFRPKWSTRWEIIREKPRSLE